MSHKGIYIRLRAALVGVLLCIFLVYYLVTVTASEMINIYNGAPDAKIITVWLIAVLLTAVPCLVCVVLGWQTSNLVKADRSFSGETARLLSKISTCALVDAGYFLIVNIVMGVLNYQTPGVIIVSAAIILLAIAFGMAFAALARFVQKAADLQEESDLTV
ncbi:MAG: DUF2975 domain-containing protein [Oscillospiraceae bacterium]|jgi:hypothetical protein|nr:DUF2975 domain-containing protein [Oscillospiraceae bacterium]